MPAPTNTSLATATAITSLPQTITQSAAFGGTTYDLWFSYTAVADDTQLGVFPFGDLVTYLPTVTFWTDVSTQYLNNDAQNRPTQIPIDPGTTYYWRVRPNVGNPTPATLTMLVQLGRTDQLNAGQLAINDSTAGYPVVVMDPLTADPVAFVHPFASGEGVCVLTSGLIAAIDTAANGVKVYDRDLTLRATPTMPATGYTECLGTNQTSTFWVGKQGGAGHGFMVSFDKDGTMGTPIDLGATGCRTLAPNSGNTKVYFARDITTANQALFVVNTSTLVVSSFLPGVGGKYFGANILMLTDNTLLVPYEAVAVDTIIQQYDESAVLQRTFTLTGVQNALERIFTDPSDPAFFWIWWQTATLNRFQRIRVADGVVMSDLSNTKFIEGDSQAAATATPTAYFGADFSCVPWILRGVAATTTYPTRRMRIFTLPFNENKRLFLRRLELFLEQGQGLITDTAAPLIMVSISRDGGFTWEPEETIEAGAVGDYQRQSILTNLGSYRNGAIKIVVSDPVAWHLMAAFGEIEEGRY
jgi:hypothetical protein